MSETAHRKVNQEHLKRNAYLYVRQSTPKQVLENTESTQRQYALRRRAAALGWPDENIIVVDSDQGQSAGVAAADREGFQRLVTEVGMDRAGIVMGLEVSRLARNNAEWHRLLEICALTDTLILDEDGIYDPADFNDRLLLGLKGTMSEAELHILRARLRGGSESKAQRQKYIFRDPPDFTVKPHARKWNFFQPRRARVKKLLVKRKNGRRWDRFYQAGKNAFHTCFNRESKWFYQDHTGLHQAVYLRMNGTSAPRLVTGINKMCVPRRWQEPADESSARAVVGTAR